MIESPSAIWIFFIQLKFFYYSNGFLIQILNVNQTLFISKTIEKFRLCQKRLRLQTESS